MMQVIETTDEEKKKMYQHLSKDKLIEMLITANKVIDSLTKYPLSTMPIEWYK